MDGEPLVAAAGLLTSGSALDPDYRTLFPGGDFADVTYADGQIVVTVADDSWNTRAPGMSRREARLAASGAGLHPAGACSRSERRSWSAAGRPVGPLFGSHLTDCARRPRWTCSPT